MLAYRWAWSPVPYVIDLPQRDQQPGRNNKPADHTQTDSIALQEALTTAQLVRRTLSSGVPPLCRVRTIIGTHGRSVTRLDTANVANPVAYVSPTQPRQPVAAFPTATADPARKTNYPCVASSRL
jgi:hypothetical protein